MKELITQDFNYQSHFIYVYIYLCIYSVIYFLQ